MTLSELSNGDCTMVLLCAQQQHTTTTTTTVLIRLLIIHYCCCCSSEAGSGVKHIQHGGVVERRQCRSGSWLGPGAELSSSRLQHGPQRVHSRAPSRLYRRVSVVVGAIQRVRVRRSDLHGRRRLLQVRASFRISAATAAVSRRTGGIRAWNWRFGDDRIGRIGRGQLAVASALHRPQHV